MLELFSPAKETKIFTDSSTYNNISCSAYIVVQNGKPIAQDHIVFKNVTNNFGELYAIMMALTYIFRTVSFYRTTDPRWIPHLKFTIFSDSLYAVDSLTKWLPKWIRDTYRLCPPFNGYYQTFPGLTKISTNYKTNQPEISRVTNAEVILECMKLVLSIGIRICIMHTKAHVGKGHKGLIKAIRNHLKSNRNTEEMRSLSLLDFEQMIKWNDQVDKLASKTLQATLSAPGGINKIPSPSWPMVFFPNYDQIRFYLSYIQ